MKANRIAELVDSIYNFYEAAGFARERLDEEFGSMSVEELEQVYLNL